MVGAHSWWVDGAGGKTLIELVEGVSLDGIKENTEAGFAVAPASRACASQPSARARRAGPQKAGSAVKRLNERSGNAAATLDPAQSQYHVYGVFTFVSADTRRWRPQSIREKPRDRANKTLILMCFSSVRRGLGRLLSRFDFLSA